MKRAYKYRFYPTEEQKKILAQTFGCCRFNYNWGLSTRKTAYLQHGQSLSYNDLAAMLELEMLLWPGQIHLQRDLALVPARIGQSHAASQWLNHYLRCNPDDPQKGDLEQLLEVLSA